MGFTLKILTSFVKSVVSFWGKKITIRKTINLKLENMFYEYTYLVAIHKYTLKKSAKMLFCHVYYHQKAK